MDILMAAGLAAAVGIRPFLPAVAVGLISGADLGAGLGDFNFLSSWTFLVAICVLALLFWVLEAISEGGLLKRVVLITLWLVSLTLGALFFAAVLDASGHGPLPGLVAGAAVAALGRGATGAFLKSAGRRVRNARANRLFTVFLEPFAVAVAVLVILFPPFSVAVIAALIYVLASMRRRSQSKYEGLRILR